MASKDLSDLRVLKFGGSSLGTEAALGRVVRIITGHSRRKRTVAVVSAMAGVTDQLLHLGQTALAGKAQKVESLLKEMSSRHRDAFSSMVAQSRRKKWIDRFLEEQFGEIREICQGIGLLREMSDRTRDKLLSYGELLSSRLLASALEEVSGKFCHSDARDWLVAEWTRQGSVVDVAETERRVRRYLSPLLRRGRLPIVPGFICRTADGEIATLGRNGSDYTASIVAAALRAGEIWIYTDVDGIFTADPNLVTEAAILPQVSYQEAAEMSYFGAKVVHPKTMIPAVVHGIPIRIKNTFNPRARGTLITERSIRRPRVKTVTSVRSLAMLNVVGNGMVGIPGVASRLFDVLAREQINVMMISQSSSEHSICIVVQESEAQRANRVIRREFALEIEKNLIEGVDQSRNVAIVSIIGAGMRGTPGISGKFFDALGRCRINVLAIAQGSSELNISAVIRERDSRHAVQAIHSAFGLTQDLNVLVLGIGRIGRVLLQQILENRTRVARTLKVNLKVLGVANSRLWRLSDEGLSEDELRLLSSGTPLADLPESTARPSFKEAFRQIAAAYKSDVVLVDATGADLAAAHIEGLRRGFHIVTANKRPLTSRLADYREIRKLCLHKGLNYQFEATFGAGLPLLSTLRDLVQTGDRVLRIQGCLSGTLGFLCTRLDEEVPFSTALSEAMSLGYTEPDPRDDLSGLDVARKALIIGRELGFLQEMEDIRLEAMIPRRLFGLSSVEAFLEALPKCDHIVRTKALQAKSRGEVLRFLAEIRPDGCEVGLKCVPRDSPIGRLFGPDNILVFQTERYSANPLVIQGPGAGAAVTSAGVLGDILKIAKWI